MTAVLLVGHADRPEARSLAASAVEWLVAHGHRAVAGSDDRQSLRLGTEVAEASNLDGVGLVLSIGGDGTMLRAAKTVGERAIPIMGVNVGLLGYLTEVEPPSLIDALESFFAGRHTLERRLILDVSVVRAAGGETRRFRALNEASFEKLTAGHTVRLKVSIDGSAFTTFQADGLIVATPTGSTAYSLSARGPVVSPTMRAVLVTPLSPHMLFDRTLVLGPDEPVVVEITGTRAVGLAVDGEFVGELASGDRVECVESPTPAVFVRLYPDRFHQVLKSKFGLADR
jgi:NAD+ kinase